MVLLYPYSEPNFGMNDNYRGLYSNISETPSLSTATHSEIGSTRSRHEQTFTVIAPAGSLGIVIGTVSGYPAVHAIKDTSKIIDQVQIGDKLISVDGEDATQMSAIRVSNLIGSKASNPRRVLVFARSFP